MIESEKKFTMEEKTVSKIFISYHSSKVELAAHVSKYMETHGIKVWYANKSIRSGEQWDEAIHNAIKGCQAVVLLFCASADASIQVKRELSLADKYKKPVFWLRVERVEPNNLSYFLTSTQWLDWLDCRDATLEKLVRDIIALDSAQNVDTKEQAFQNEAYSVPTFSNWAKGILAFDSDRDAAECAARTYFALAKQNPDSSVILPTGRSATQIFRAMLRIADEYEGCPFGDAHLISDTETFGVWNEHETSRTRHIYDALIKPLSKKNKAPSEEQLHLLSGIYTDNDPVRKAQMTIRAYPPIIHAVSVSPVGEIIAYEVGTYNEIEEIIDDAPRIVEVSEHSKKYIDPSQPSKSIISIGLGTALSSSVLLILAFDIQKANILSRLFSGPMTAGIPATLLREHRNAYVLTTKAVVREAKIGDMTIGDKTAKEGAEWIISG